MAESTESMDAILKIGYLNQSPAEKALLKLRRKRLYDQQLKEQREHSLTRQD